MGSPRYVDSGPSPAANRPGGPPPSTAARPPPLSVLPVDGPPDWGRLTVEVRCPLCDYDLRGLSEPRCPECGYRFAWRDLLDPSRRSHPYLFEHHPKRNVWSFYRTARGLLLPWRFWGTLQPTQPSRPRRLVLYWAIAMVIALAGAVGLYVVVGVALNVEWNQNRPPPSPTIIYGPGNAFSLQAAPLPPPRGRFAEQGMSEAWYRIGPGYAAWWAWGCAWPWLTLASLMIFRVSMRRARVKTVHVLRCVLYSGEGVMWGGVCLLALAGGQLAATALGSGTGGDLMRLPHLVFPLVALGVIFRLYAGYKLYLRFDHPLATIVASQVIVSLVGIIVLVNAALT